jgi:hypothetical protein
MSWPLFISSQFKLVPEFTTDESIYFGPFNALLNSVFPPSEFYQIATQSKHIAGSIDFNVMLIIGEKKVPLMIIKAMTNVAFDTPSSRKAADDHMRESILDFSPQIYLMPTLYGLSFFGTRFCVYLYAPADHTLSPRRIDPHPDTVTDTAPKDRWSLDFCEKEGEYILNELFNHIKELAKNVLNAYSS